jgi:AAA family ATP:ADP antiporter
MGRRRRIAASLETALRIRPGELGLALLLFLQLHALVGAFVVGRSVRDTIFLAQVSPSALPWVYILSSAAVAAVGAAYARFGAHRRLDRMLPATALFFAATLVAVRLALARAGTWLPAALYAWVEVMGTLTLIQFWSFASALCDSRQAKRLFGLVAGGGTVAGVVAGFAVGALARRGGTPALLWLGAAYLVAAAGMAALVIRAAGPRSWTHRPTLPRLGGAEASLGRDPHLRALALLTVLTFLTITFVDYQFKAAASARFGRDASEMARFFGLLTGATGLAGLALQLGLLGRILERSGVAAALALLPAGLGLGSGIAALTGGFWSATLSKAAELSIRYTANDSATQLLSVPLPALRRARSKAFVDGVVRPATVAAAGAVLLFYPLGSMGTRPLAIACLLLVCLWLLSLGIVHRRYLDALRDALRRGRLDLDAAPRRFGEEAVRAVRRALGSGDPAEVEGALSLARQMDADLSAEVAPLLSHGAPRTRALACRALTRAGGAAAAVVEPLLRDPEAEVRAAAAGATLRMGGAVDAAGAREVVAALAAGASPAERLLAARALADAGPAASPDILLRLLSDVDLEVRRAALAAAGEARIPELMPALLRRLAPRETARAAAEALAAWGAGAEPGLAGLLGDRAQEPPLRCRASWALGRIGTPAAVHILLRHVDAEDDSIRNAVHGALARTALRHPETPIDRDRLARVLRVELELAWRALAAAEALGLPEGDGPPPAGREAAARHLLAGALREKVARAVDRALLLCRVLRPDGDLDLARERLSDGSSDRRAAALELVDALLDGSLRRRLVPLLDDRPRAGRLRDAEALYATPRLAPEAWLAELLRDESPWLLAAACHAAGELRIAGAAPRVRELLAHRAPYVREAALAAVARLLPAEEAAVAARALAADPFEPARQLALRLSAGPQGRGEAPG